MSTLIALIPAGLICCTVGAGLSHPTVIRVEPHGQIGITSNVTAFHSLAAATLHARGLRGAVRVEVAAGEHFLTEPLLLDARDSNLDFVGDTDDPSVSAIVYGGLRLQQWEAVSKGVYRCRLPPGTPPFFNLVEGTRAAVMARSPNRGSGYLATTHVGRDTVEWQAGALPEQFECGNEQDQQEHCSMWVQESYWSEMSLVTAANLTARQFHITPGSGAFGPTGNVYVRGAVEFIDEPGEWARRGGYVYYRPFIEGIPISVLTIVATTAGPELVKIAGCDAHSPVHDISFRYINFVGSDFSETWSLFPPPPTWRQQNTMPAAARHGMIYVENASDIQILGCRLMAAGHSALFLQGSVQRVTLSGCWVEEPGFCGVYLNGFAPGEGEFTTAAQSHVNREHEISHNVLYDGGLVVASGAGVYAYQAGDMLIEHNRIHRFPRDGIGFYGTLPSFGDTAYSQIINGHTIFDVLHCRGNTVRYNDISSCSRDSRDTGVVESWGAGRDNLWLHNAVHDNDVNGEAMSVLFADDWSPHLTIRGNLLYENKAVGGNALAVMMKSINNSFTENVVAHSTMDCGGNLAFVGTYRLPAANLTMAHNLWWDVVLDGITPAYSARWGAHTELADTMNSTIAVCGNGNPALCCCNVSEKSMQMSQQELMTPVIASIDYNFYGGGGWRPNMTSLPGEQPPMAAWDAHSSISPELSPHFLFRRAAATGAFSPAWRRDSADYELDPHSALVQQLGLTPWNTSLLGPQPQVSRFNVTHLLGARNAQERQQAERFDRVHGFYTVRALGIGPTEPPQSKLPCVSCHVAAGSWSMYKRLDFTATTPPSSLTARFKTGKAKTFKFRLESPDNDGFLLATVPCSGDGNATAAVTAADATGFLERTVPLDARISAGLAGSRQTLFLTADDDVVVDWFQFNWGHAVADSALSIV